MNRLSLLTAFFKRFSSGDEESVHGFCEATFRKRIVKVGVCIFIGAILFSFACSLGFCWLSPVVKKTDVLMLAVSIPAVIAPLSLWVTGRQQMNVFRLLKENHRLANHDSLTGLVNRRAFFSKADEMLTHAVVCPLQFAAMVVDADDFKTINDTYGHQVGDDALKLIASCMTSALPSDALIARMGGEEFAILVLAESLAAIREMGEALCRSVVQESLGELPNRLTVSVGLCSWKVGMDVPTLLSNADMALYDAKTNGKNQLSVAAADEMEKKDRTYHLIAD